MIYLLSSLDELNFLEKNKKNAITIFYNYIDYANSRDNSSRYFYEKISYNGNEKNLAFIESLTLNWHRNRKGKDLLYFDHLGIGQILTRRLMFVFTNTVKISLALNYWISKYKKIYISNNLKESFQFIDNKIKKNIFWIKFKKNNKTNFLLRTSIFDLKIHKLSNIARYLQKFFIKKNKIMYFKDWFSKEFFLYKDVLTLNNLNFLRGYYFNSNKKIILYFNKKFPKKIDKYLDKENLKNIFNIKLNKKFDLSKIFLQCVKKIYSENKKKIIFSYSTIFELLEYYRPKTIFLPGENSAFHVTILIIAKLLKIKTNIILDGYFLYPQKSIFYKDHLNSSFLFDKYFAYGEAQKNIMINSGLRRNNIEVIKSPIRKLKSVSKKIKKRYDAIILPLSFSHYNFESADNLLFYECQIIKLLEEINFKNILIKLKPGLKIWDNNRSLDIYKNLYKKIYNNDIKCNLQISKEPFRNVARFSKLVIGQPSTALIESVFYNIPFYLYCPNACGISKTNLKSSTIFRENEVAKNIIELKKNILLRNKLSIYKNIKSLSGFSFDILKY